jgi:hypothetical protein
MTLLQIHMITKLAQYEQGASYQPATAHKNFLAAAEPAMQRLLQLSEHKDAALAAAAYEGYAAILMSHKGSGVAVELPGNLAARLDASLSSAPRLLLWDLRIAVDALKVSKDSTVIINCHQTARKRIEQFPSARGYAILASSAPAFGEQVNFWEKATAMEPENLLYQLNHVAAQMRHDDGDKNLVEVMKRLQELGDKGYENHYWESSPQHNSYRLRLFAIQQALVGKQDAAMRVLDQLLRTNPADAEAQSLRDLLDQKPQ